MQDDEWFVVNQLSQQIYCMDFVKNNFVATNYSFMPKDKYGKIDFIVSVQDEGNVFVFQKITPSYIYEKQKILSWEHTISPTDQAVLSNHKNVLVIKEGADCYYIKDTDKLYFRNLKAITSIFDGINILYREATNQEVEEFFNMEMINVTDGFTKDDVKTANRRRIKEATERYRSFSHEQKARIPSYIRKYCPHIYNEATSQFNVNDENSITEYKSDNSYCFCQLKTLPVYLNCLNSDLTKGVMSQLGMQVNISKTTDIAELERLKQEVKKVEKIRRFHNTHSCAISLYIKYLNAGFKYEDMKKDAELVKKKK